VFSSPVETPINTLLLPMKSDVLTGGLDGGLGLLPVLEEPPPPSRQAVRAADRKRIDNKRNGIKLTVL
jgi:hypothetical protein